MNIHTYTNLDIFIHTYIRTYQHTHTHTFTQEITLGALLPEDAAEHVTVVMRTISNMRVLNVNAAKFVDLLGRRGDSTTDAGLKEVCACVCERGSASMRACVEVRGSFWSTRNSTIDVGLNEGCVCVCVREREREREKECVRMCVGVCAFVPVCLRMYGHMCVFVWVSRCVCTCDHKCIFGGVPNHQWVMSRTWMSHVIYLNGLSHACKCVILVCASGLMLRSRFTHIKCIIDSHIWLSRDTHIYSPFPTHGWVTSHTWCMGGLRLVGSLKS